MKIDSISSPYSLSPLLASATLLLSLALAGLALLAVSFGHVLESRQLAYYAGREGNYEVYLTDIGRSLVTNLTRNPGEDTRPSWSPDGEQIVFYSQRDSRIDVHIMNADGSDLRRLAQTGNTGKYLYPSWSPDGEWIAFASSYQRDAGIYLIRPDGSGLHRLTTFRASLIVWSPDSRRLALMADCDNNCDLYVVDQDGSNLRRLTRNGVFDTYPSWSPDGEQFVFMSNRDQSLELYVLNLNCDEKQLGGCDVHRLTFNRDFDGFPVWSPDGQSILFSSDRDGNFEIYTLSADCIPEPETCAASTHRLTNRTGSDLSPVWSPDGSQIAFIAVQDIYVMNVICSGCPSWRLVGGVLSDQTLAWRP